MFRYPYYYYRSMCLPLRIYNIIHIIIHYYTSQSKTKREKRVYYYIILYIYVYTLSAKNFGEFSNFRRRPLGMKKVYFQMIYNKGEKMAFQMKKQQQFLSSEIAKYNIIYITFPRKL